MEDLPPSPIQVTGESRASEWGGSTVSGSPQSRMGASPRSSTGRLMTPRHYSRALPKICSPTAPVGAKHARAVLSQTLDDVHWGLAAKSLVGSHRKGKKNDWMRDIAELDLPPWSMRAGMGASPKPQSPRTRRVQSLGKGQYCLHSDEHVSKHLAQRLEHGQRQDEAELARALTSNTTVGNANQIAERGIKPLMEMAESRYKEIQRDAAAALYSLSISDNNKVAFMEAKALDTLVKLARSTDTDIRRNVSGAMYRLAMHKSIKRHFVAKTGVLKPLLNFITGENRDAQRSAIMCLKELCENKENRSDLFEQTPAQPMLDAIFELVNNVDPRVRLTAALTLVALLGESANRLIMLDAGSLPRMLGFLQSRDPQLRRFAVDCIVHITKLQEIHPLPIEHCHIVRADDVLASIVEAFGTETDPGLLLGLLKSLLSLILLVKQDARRMKQRLYEFGLLMKLLEHAKCLIDAEQQTADTLELLAQIVRMLSSLTSRSKPRLECIHETGHDHTIVLLCKSVDKKIRRGAVRLLGRLSTLVKWKEGIVSDTELLPLLLSMCKLDDTTIQVTAAQIVAEIAELPTTRVAMVEAGAVPVLVGLLRLDDARVHRDVMRTMAALAEAVENRESLSYRALLPILSMMWKEDQTTQAASIRALANLAAPAGIVSESPESLMQQQNAAESGSNLHGDSVDEKLNQELKLKATRTIFKVVGRFGSSFVPREDYEGEEQQEFSSSLMESSSVVTSREPEIQASENPAGNGDQGSSDVDGDGNDDSDDSGSSYSSAPSAESSSESVQRCTADRAVAAAEEARARAIAAVTAARKERRQVANANDPSWWDTAEGKELRFTYNYSSLERIHLKLVEAATFTDLFNPDLPELSAAGVHASADLIRFLGRTVELPVEPAAAAGAETNAVAADEENSGPELDECKASSGADNGVHADGTETGFDLAQTKKVVSTPTTPVGPKEQQGDPRAQRYKSES